jgi:hypothetical protein
MQGTCWHMRSRSPHRPQAPLVDQLAAIELLRGMEREEPLALLLSAYG